MSSYRIIHNASKILSRVSAHGLPETAAAEMGYRFRTGDMDGASSAIVALMDELRASMEMKDILRAFMLMDVINSEMLFNLIGDI